MHSEVFGDGTLFTNIPSSAVETGVITEFCLILGGAEIVFSLFVDQVLKDRELSWLCGTFVCSYTDPEQAVDMLQRISDGRFRQFILRRDGKTLCKLVCRIATKDDTATVTVLDIEPDRFEKAAVLPSTPGLVRRVPSLVLPAADEFGGILNVWS